MSRRAVVMLAVGVVLGTATPGQAEPVKIRYVVDGALGSTDRLSGAEPSMGPLGPNDADGRVVLRPNGATVTLSFDDIGAGAGEAIWVHLSQQRAPRPALSKDLCIPARVPYRLTGLAAGRWLTVQVKGEAYGDPLSLTTECTGVALGGTLSVEGATWIPWGGHGEPPPDPNYAKAGGCRVVTHDAGETQTCRFTATHTAGWVSAPTMLGVPLDSWPQVTVVVERKGKKTTHRTLCGTNLIRPGDRVTATLHQAVAQRPGPPTMFNGSQLSVGKDGHC